MVYSLLSIVTISGNYAKMKELLQVGEKYIRMNKDIGQKNCGL